jgi:hypothetical protein
MTDTRQLQQTKVREGGKIERERESCLMADGSVTALGLEFEPGLLPDGHVDTGLLMDHLVNFYAMLLLEDRANAVEVRIQFGKDICSCNHDPTSNAQSSSVFPFNFLWYILR